jgi:hypothetical protein
VAKTIGKSIEERNLPIYVQRFGLTVDDVFVTAPELRHMLGDRFNKLPVGAIGYYTYYQRVAQGLRQLMAGARKFAVKHITRDDIAALTPEAAHVSGLQMVSDIDREESERVLSDSMREAAEKVLGSR